MTDIFICPGKYIQGEGALKELGASIDHYGTKCIVIASHSALKQNEQDLKEGFSGKEIIFENFSGKECCKREIKRVVNLCKDKGIEFVVGFGGGKPQDMAKAVAFKLGYLPVIIIPTIASSDAPTSALSVIYDEGGSFDEYWFYKQNPNIVLVDTGIIAKAPARFLVAGMGDGLATYFEAQACIQSGGLSIAGGSATNLAPIIADLCYDILLNYGVLAKEANEKNIVTPALDKVVEANTLLSGLGFENNGVASAHGIHDGLTILKDVHHVLHGEKVGFCTIAQLVLEGQSSETCKTVIQFCHTVGLPITLAELGITKNVSEKIKKVSESVNWDIAKNHSFEVTAHTIYNAIIFADYLGQNIVTV